MRSAARGAIAAQSQATVRGWTGSSVAATTPSGTLKVASIDAKPYYRYNPDYKFKGVKSKRAFEINPGPNNPVGVVWIDLNKEHLGFHGTPEPTRIGRSQSHGCLRLTNWDAARLALMIKPGTKAVFRA